MILLEKGVLSRLTKLNGEIGSLGESSDLSKRVEVKGEDEITSLAQSLNAMLERIENTSLKLTRAERFSTIGELATMVGNDLRNPLQGIRNATYSLRKGTNQVEQSRRMLDEIEKSIIYSDNIVRSLVEYSQELRPELTRTTPKAIATKALLSIEVPNNIHLVDRANDDETAIKVDSNLLSRALANLIQNAVEAMPKGGNLTVESIPLNGKLEFNVIDTGCGFPEEFKSKIGNPLVTRKARGMGFGLAITKRILEAHGGSLQAESIAGKGSTFKIVLPLTELNATTTQNNYSHLN
jgi:signal transduction histidine kinase